MKDSEFENELLSLNDSLITKIYREGINQEDGYDIKEIAMVVISNLVEQQKVLREQLKLKHLTEPIRNEI